MGVRPGSSSEGVSALEMMYTVLLNAPETKVASIEATMKERKNLENISVTVLKVALECELVNWIL